MDDPTVTTWEPLYTRDPHNNLLVWKVWAQDNIVYRTYGRVGGKLRDPVGRTISGTAFEPSAEKQALLYAQRAWDKKVKSSYSPESGGTNSVSGDEATNSVSGDEVTNSVRGDEVTGGGGGTGPISSLFPMHASTYEQTDLCLHKHLEITRGAYIQPKLDGVRCVATATRGGEVVLSSRTGKSFPWFQKIRKDLEPLLAKLPASFLGLDGEIYCGSFVQDGRELEGAERFAAISGSANIHRGSPSQYEDQLSLYVFDCIDADFAHTQTERFAVLDSVFHLQKSGSRVVRVPTYVVSSPNDAEHYHDRFVAEGFEGAVLRAKGLVYTPRRRSLKMRKYKRFDTDEFTIVGAKPGEGTESGAVVWICRQKKEATFDCRPASSIAERRALFAEWPRYVGCLLTVKYQGLSADNIPRFPVGLGIRHEFIG